jgi:hypothetical protein
MKLTDVAISPFTVKIKFTKDMDEYLMEAFTDYLQDRNLISKSPLNKTLGLWINAVPYHDFSELFDAFWKQMLDEIPGGKIGETIMGVAVQIASILQKMKPPERTILRDTAKTRIALQLLNSIAQS